MAQRFAIEGSENTGKSFARSFIKKGEECFLLSPTPKFSYLTDSDGNPVKRLNLKTDSNPTTNDLLKVVFKENAHKKNTGDLIKFLVKNPDKAAKIVAEGNHIVATLDQLGAYLKFISDYMPHIKNVFIGDFSLFLSHVLATQEFIERKQGGEAYQRFWELAGETVREVLESSNHLREDLVIGIEFHTEFNEKEGVYKIFVPGGNMLDDKFKIHGYFDFELITTVELDEKTKEPSAYQFITRRNGPHKARFGNLFQDTFIPNDLQLVLDTFRKAHGI